MTIPTSIAASSSSLFLAPSLHLPATSASSVVDISPSAIRASTMPAQGMTDARSTQQQETEQNLARKRLRRSRQVRFDSKISGRRIVSYSDEVRADIYYNVSHPGASRDILMC